MTIPRSAELELSGVTGSIPQARRFTRQTLTDWGLDLQVDAAALVVSELATNAVLHARSSFTVRLRVEGDGRLRLEVVDASPRQPELRRHSQAATTGRGMAIVAELADDWGVEPATVGKAVWVRLRETDADSSTTSTGSRTDAQGGAAAARPDGPQVLAA